VHPLLACLCNSRIVQPARAGEGPSWPLLLLWGGLLAAAAVGAAVWLVRRRRSAASAGMDERWDLTGTFVGGADTGVGDDRDGSGPGPAPESDAPGDAEQPVGAPGMESETAIRR